MKECTKCKEQKDLSEFSKKKKSKDGLQYACKSCIKEYNKDNKEKIAENTKQYYKENKEKIKQYKKENTEKIKQYKKKYRKENKEYVKQYDKEYRKDNKEKIKENRNARQKNRRQSDPLFKLSCNLRTSISNSLRNEGYAKASKTSIILGCTFEEFKVHLESLFEPWMDWSKYGNPDDGIFEPNKTFDLDHIIPLSAAETEEDIINLNHYSNLQPLCSFENRFIKRDNY
tara:strand:+ start:35 stop:721 length:687 start_codon:yes stop_codon:yes gene_type:complete